MVERVFTYAIGAYGFIIPYNGRMTVSRLADEIEKMYATSPRLVTILAALRRNGEVTLHRDMTRRGITVERGAGAK